jgi:DNA-binding transcriptional LysR family regulator
MPSRLPRTTLEQWAVLDAVVDHGGFAPAADALGRSQSSVSYMVRQLQDQVPVPLLETKGRKAQLTEQGAVLLRRARALLEDARSVEALAASLAQGWEPEIRLAVDTIFPPALLLRALEAFAPVSRATRVELVEAVLSGTQEVLLRREVELAITGMPPPGFLGAPLMPVEFVAVSHPAHPLQRLGRPLTTQDLKAHRQLVVRDSGSRRRLDAGWLGADERWTVTNRTTQIELLKHGLGFAWVPREYVWSELEQGELAPLPLAEGGTRNQEIYLVYADQDSAGPATRELARILVETCRDECSRRGSESRTQRNRQRTTP